MLRTCCGKAKASCTQPEECFMSLYTAILIWLALWGVTFFILNRWFSSKIVSIGGGFIASLLIAMVVIGLMVPNSQQEDSRRVIAAEKTSKPAPKVQASISSAPLGDPKSIAIRAITEAGHPCPQVVAASRNSDGSVSAVCSNQEDYRIFSVNMKIVVMRCSAVRDLGVSGC